MASAGARAYNGSGVQGLSPRWGSGLGEAAPKMTRFMCLKHYQCICYSFAWTDVLFESFLFRAFQARTRVYPATP